MDKVSITIACQPCDRTRPLIDGSVRVEGCTAVVLPLLAEETFFRAFTHREFEVSELSMSSYLLGTSRGDCPYIGIPVFLLRTFRHAALYVRADRGIKHPSDLRGKLVGVPEYQMTAALWVKGMLSDVYGVRAEEIRWRTGGLEDAGRTEKYPLRLPPQFDVQPIPTDQTLSSLLARGALDALVSPRVPSSFREDGTEIVRLFPDFRAAEQEYFRKTGLFPVMHLMGIRRDVAERYPWLAASVFKAFVAAKAQCTAELDALGGPQVTLPWLAAEVRATKALMGEDYWPYGIEPNRKVIAAMLRYSCEQGIIAEPPSIEALFAAGTLDHFRI
jgi:4,5-dihydroxyphthalate decarboxylase